MKLLIQVGALGCSVIDHLITPIAYASNVQNVFVFCRFPGPNIPKVEYRCPPKLLAKLSIVSLIYEFCDMFFRALSNRSSCLAGCLINPHGIIAFIIAKLTRKKVIISLIAGRAELYTKGSIRGIDFNSTLPPWYDRLFLKMLKHSDKIITTGSITKLFLIRNGIQSEKIYPIISPANKSRFYPAQNTKIYDVISVGYLSIIKHHEVLLYAISAIKRKYSCIRACIVGDGPRKSELRQLASELGITENIDFLGYQNDVEHYYHSSRIFVHTSEREGFPNVVLEAMMCGLPCVVSDCGDIVDISKDGFNSFVIPEYYDAQGFTNAIMNLLENEELYKKISRNALRTMELISSEDVTRSWESIMDDIGSLYG